MVEAGGGVGGVSSHFASPDGAGLAPVGMQKLEVDPFLTLTPVKDLNYTQKVRHLRVKPPLCLSAVFLLLRGDAIPMNPPRRHCFTWRCTLRNTVLNYFASTCK